MNRIFHVKIAGGTYFLLILLTAVMVFAFWCMKAMIGLVVALGLIIIIERIIHSTYTLTADGKLVVYYGRFYKGKTLPHHTVNHTVEKHFHFSRHVSPIARGTDYHCIGFFHRLQHSLCPILGQTTLQ